MDSRNIKRITVFAGHYGSGKTNIAVNYALKLKKIYDKVSIADIDIVNPYFRTKDSKEILDKNNIRLISSAYANSNVDTPALPSEIYSVFEDKSMYGVVDLGGDDRGALALGRYRDIMVAEKDYEMLFVINKYRYLTSTPEKTIEVLREIEEASKVAFTGIVNNSNLGCETMEKTFESSLSYAREVSKISGLPIKFHTIRQDLYENLSEKENVFPINIYVSQGFKA